MGLARAARAKGDDVLAPLDPVAAGKLQNLHLVQLRDRLEVEAVELEGEGAAIFSTREGFAGPNPTRAALMPSRKRRKAWQSKGILSWKSGLRQALLMFGEPNRH